MFIIVNVLFDVYVDRAGERIYRWRQRSSKFKKKNELEPYIFLAKSSDIFLLVDDETTNTLLSTLSRRSTNDID